MPNLQHSPLAKSEANDEEPHPQGASSATVSTTENEDFFVQKGNKIGFDEHEEQFLQLIDNTVAFLVKTSGYDQTVEELVGQLRMLQISLGQDRVNQFFKYIELWDKFEERRDTWQKAIDEASNQQSSDRLLALMIDKEVTDGVYTILLELQKLTQKNEEEARKLTPVHETPLPAYKATFKTVVNTPILHTKAKQVPSDVSSVGSSAGNEKLMTDLEDPTPGLSFDQRKALEPSYAHYRQVSFRMAHPRRRFDTAIKTLESEINEEDEVDPEQVKHELSLVKKAYHELKNYRLEATKDFSYWTLCQDTYLDEILAQYIQIRDLCKAKLSGVKGALGGEDAKHQCQHCASPRFFTHQELIRHQQTYHNSHMLKIGDVPSIPYQKPRFQRNMGLLSVAQPTGQQQAQVTQRNINEQDGDNLVNENSAGTIGVVSGAITKGELRGDNSLPPRKPPGDQGYPGKNGQDGNGNGPPPGPPDDNDEFDHEQDEDNADSITSSDFNHGNAGDLQAFMTAFMATQERSRRQQAEVEEKRMKRTEQHYLRMAQMNSKATFDAEKYCSIFSAEAVKDNKDMLQTFANWKVDFDECDRLMTSMSFSNMEKYRILKQRLSGSAQRLVTVKHPNDDSYDNALKKLTDQFVNTSLEIRDIYSRMKNMPKMDPNSATKVSAMVTEFTSLMDQLTERNPSKDDLFFLLFSELLVPKFNATAEKGYKRIWKAKSDENGAPMGHKITTQDLKKVLTDTRDELQFHEYNKVFNSNPDAKAIQDRKKKIEEEKKKKDIIFGSNQTSNEGQTSQENSAITNGKGTCPIPNCKASLDPAVEGGHRWILKCPVMKKMKPNDLWAWFCSKKGKCVKCFSPAHEAQNCPLKRFLPCKKILLFGERAGETCNGDHCIYLHREIKPKQKKNEGNASNQTQVPTSGDSNAGQGAANGEGPD
jgi:hypothetical protein